MPRRVLIVPDKFKGTLTAHEAASAIAAGWRAARPDDALELLPMTDGGDGFGEVMGELLQARRRKTRALDAAHQPVDAPWWFDSTRQLAIIDSARVIGLAMLPPRKFHPFQLDSFGLGKVIQTAAKAGAAKILLGIGGSATNDAGFGLACALGWQFFNRAAQPLGEWWQLHELAEIRPPAGIFDAQITVAVDVGNPLLGPKGASRIYGPQKGLRAEDFALAEKCLGRLAVVLRQQHGIECADVPGTGAAGGLGFGLIAFARGKLESGFEIFSRHAQLDKRIRRADLVITGEGRIDEQTYMGKGVGQIAQRCAALGVPCLALAGTSTGASRGKHLFTAKRCLTEITELPEALSRAGRHLQTLASLVARHHNF